jgi:hypothetical protein
MDNIIKTIHMHSLPKKSKEILCIRMERAKEILKLRQLLGLLF